MRHITIIAFIGLIVIAQDLHANQTLLCKWEFYRDEKNPTFRRWGPGQPMKVQTSAHTLRINNDSYAYFKESIGPNGAILVHYRRKEDGRAEMATLATTPDGTKILSLLNGITTENYSGACK